MKYFNYKILTIDDIILSNPKKILPNFRKKYTSLKILNYFEKTIFKNQILKNSYQILGKKYTSLTLLNYSKIKFYFKLIKCLYYNDKLQQ
jgi:hypothetical protein